MANVPSAEALDRLGALLTPQHGRRRKERTSLSLVPLVRGGLRYKVLESVMRYASLSIEDVSGALDVARRTLDRRKVDGRLDAGTSEKVVRLARVATRAEVVLGSVDAMRTWLRTQNRALGHVAPLSLLDTDLGTDAVLDVLGRLEHGVYS